MKDALTDYEGEREGCPYGLREHCDEWGQDETGFFVDDDVGVVIKGGGLEVDDDEGDVAFEGEVWQGGGWHDFERGADDQEEVAFLRKLFCSRKLALRHALAEEDGGCFEVAAAEGAGRVNFARIDTALQCRDRGACAAEGAGCLSRRAVQFNDALRSVTGSLVQPVEILGNDGLQKLAAFQFRQRVVGRVRLSRRHLP